MPAYVYKFVNKNKPHSLNDMKWEVIIKKDEYPIIPQWIIDEAEDYGTSYHLPLKRVRTIDRYFIQLNVPCEPNEKYGSSIPYEVKVGQDVSNLLGLISKSEEQELKESEEHIKKLQEFKEMLKEVIKEYPNEVKDWLFYGRFDND